MVLDVLKPLTLCSLVACAPVVAEKGHIGNQVDFLFGEQLVSVPASFILDELPSDVIGNSPTSDLGAASLSLKVPIQYFWDDIEVTSGQQFVVLHLSTTRAKNYQELLLGYPRDAWDGTGAYRNRIVQSDTKTGLIRVYRRAGLKREAWHYFSKWPGAGPYSEEFWRARCREWTGFKDRASSEEVIACNTIALASGTNSNMKVKIFFPHDLVDESDAIRNRITGLVSNWTERSLLE